MNCSLRKLRSLIESLVEHRKIYVTRDGKISNRRAEIEIDAALETSRKRAENGSKGGRKFPYDPKKDSEINETRKHLLNKTEAIPEPYIKEDSSDALAEGFDPAVPHSHLLEALNRNKGASRYAETAKALRRK